MGETLHVPTWSLTVWGLRRRNPVVGCVDPSRKRSSVSSCVLLASVPLLVSLSLSRTETGCCLLFFLTACRFDLSRVQPQKEWWRERRVAPATFFGFPDITKAGLRGGSLYTEQMDAVTLAVLADKCVQENVWDPEIWLKFSWRAQQLSTRTEEPDLCYIFRAFARADWFDQNLLTTYLGRLHRRLPQFQLPDVTVLLEAFENPRFRQGEYLQKSLTHMALLLQLGSEFPVQSR
ncbi:Zdhhc9 [Symbiodinium natans]|uniref:Zdhhc9 protein n=1 Tax=Symbiodinium natans TaxID=878477 RepID=A0A812P759_9DINO|nr:Zdhhc9 [Symbiodinium natans]